MTKQSQVDAEQKPEEAPEADALKTELAEAKAKNEQLQSQVEDFDKITLDPAKLSQYLDQPLTGDAPARPEEATGAPFKLEDLSDEGRMIVNYFQTTIQEKEAGYVQRERRSVAAQELASLQEANPTLFNELKDELARVATQNPGITPKTAWKLVTQEVNLEKAKEAARAEIKESMEKKESTSKVSKPGHVGTVTQDAEPAKDKKEAFERAWSGLGDATEAL